MLSNTRTRVFLEGPLCAGRVLCATLSLPCFPACLVGWPFLAFPLRPGEDSLVERLF